MYPHPLRPYLAWSVIVLLTSIDHARADSTRVLFIGNSYTYSNDLPGMFRDLALSLGDTVETGMSAPGGYTFFQHTTNAATQAAISQGNWDFVVLQEQSQLPSFSPEQVAQEVYPHATRLVQQVREANPCTEVIFLMTWGRENGDASNCANYPPICTYEGMQQRLRDSYVHMAHANLAWCAPVGAVWKRLREISPDVSLYTDGSHPNTLGTFIAANTLASTILRRPTTSSVHLPTGLAPEDAITVRDLASAIVADSSNTWNIGVNDPQAQFDWTDLGDGSVLFANNTIGAVGQTWSFGDGSTSSDFDPLHTYASSGQFTVTMAVSDACGRMDTAITEISLLPSSILQEAAPSSIDVRYDDRSHELVILCPEGPAMVEFLDATGRSLRVAGPLSGTTTMNLDRGLHGSLYWRVTVNGGLQRTGRIILP